MIKKYSFDDDIIEACIKTGRSQLKVYSPHETMVVLGRASKIETELNKDACLSDDCPVYQRHGGGCSVVLDKGNVIVSLTLPVKGIGNNNRYFSIISQWLIENLAHVGIEGIKHDGISDLVLGDKKIAGSCIYRTKDVLYYSVSILADADIDLFKRYLKHPPREPKYRNLRSHKDFNISLKKDAMVLRERLKSILKIETLTEKISKAGG